MCVCIYIYTYVYIYIYIYIYIGLTLPCPQLQRTYHAGPREQQQCVCVPGYFLLGGACQQCAPDLYNPVPNQTTCQGCPARSFGSTVVTDCECEKGRSEWPRRRLRSSAACARGEP